MKELLGFALEGVLATAHSAVSIRWGYFKRR